MSGGARQHGAGECPLGIDPADVAAWALDAHGLEGVDLDRHVPECATCQAVVAALEPSASAGAVLRAAAPSAPAAVAHRALDRIGLERDALAVGRALGGGLARVLAALPDLVNPPRNAPGRGRGPDRPVIDRRQP